MEKNTELKFLYLAKQIEIAQERNKDEKKTSLQDVSRDMFEAAPEIAPFIPER